MDGNIIYRKKSLQNLRMSRDSLISFMKNLKLEFLGFK